MKNALREIVVSVGPSVLPSNILLEKLLAISLLTRNYAKVFSTRRYKTREEMWRSGLDKLLSSQIIYLEFGVWRGNSINYIASIVSDANARFFGFDSFEGLPENWETMARTNDAGMFSLDGISPRCSDARVNFVKGWFQDTVPEFIGTLQIDSYETLVVHYDADLYSSTLLCLMSVDRLKKKYLAIFDEFPGHETRALYNYQQATGAQVEFIGRVGPSRRYPWQVMAWITPQSHYCLRVPGSGA